jgi:cytochrome c-type biogenesis protein CcmH
VLRWVPLAVFLLALVLALPAWPATAAADGPPTVHDVASELMCQCGCGLTVAACQESMTCNIGDSMVQEIQRRIDAGESKQEILNAFVAVYGEQVLASPRKSGFSLTVWVAPFVALALGGVVVSALVWAWVRRRPAPVGAEVLAESSDDLDLYGKQVDEELRLLE